MAVHFPSYNHGFAAAPLKFHLTCPARGARLPIPGRFHAATGPRRSQDKGPTMEAERLNSLVNLVDDLRKRLVELRGYL